MKRLYFIKSFASYLFLSFLSFVNIMPVKTRSQKQPQQQQYNNSAANQEIFITASADAPHSNKRPRRVKVVTHSFIEANTRTYKVYSPRNKPQDDGASASASKKKKNRALAFKDEAADDAAAVQALLALQTHDYDDDENNANEFQHSDHTDNHHHHDDDENPSSPSSAASYDDPATIGSGSHQHHKCLNPMNPISKYIYRMVIYNIAQTVHYKTAYILYDSKSRLYHVYTIISNQMPHQETVSESGEPRTEFTLPCPHDTIQTKYKSYIDDTITNLIMTMIIPSDDHDYYIQDDILGVVIQPHEFQKKAFGEESSFYDIEDLVYDDTSSETTNGYKAFMLIPSRNYWYTPSGAYYYTPTEANTVAYRDNRYTPQTLHSILSIISQSC